jgi:hypothetical protein
MRESLNVSQRSSLFPWDNAGATSSQGGMVGVSGQYSDRVSLDRMDIINKSLSRKGSSSRMGSVLSGVGLSPGHDSRFVEDFAFDGELLSPCPMWLR